MPRSLPMLVRCLAADIAANLTVSFLIAEEQLTVLSLNTTLASAYSVRRLLILSALRHSFDYELQRYLEFSVWDPVYEEDEGSDYDTRQRLRRAWALPRARAMARQGSLAAERIGVASSSDQALAVPMVVGNVLVLHGSWGT